MSDTTMIPDALWSTQRSTTGIPIFSYLEFFSRVYFIATEMAADDTGLIESWPEIQQLQRIQHIF